MKTLVVLTGPTGVGKTELSLRLAEALGSPILSCDSRQIYREMSIGTAAPTAGQLARVPHHFIASRSILEPYSAAQFETDVLKLSESLFEKQDTLLMTGGSMLYIDAVCKGIDDMPDIDPEVRRQLNEEFRQSGLEPLLQELSVTDPAYYVKVDRKNPKRVIHGLEMYRSTGRRISDFRTSTVKQRPFRIVRICLDRDRSDLYARIDARVDQMLADGLEAEARSLLSFRELNALNTVGYKELFTYFDGHCSLEQAVSSIKTNTHTYARKQLTWFRKDGLYRWFHPSQEQEIRGHLAENGIQLIG